MRESTPVVLLATLLATASLAGCLGMDEETSGIEEERPDDGVDPIEETTPYAVEDCIGIQPGWTTDREALDELVGPRWTPAPASAVPGVDVDAEPDEGVFFLFGYECSSTSLDGTAHGSTRGGAALVALEPPEQTRGVGEEAWIAAIQHVSPSSNPALDVFEAYRFPVEEGEVSLQAEEFVQGAEAQLGYETEDGRVDVTAYYGEEPEPMGDGVAVVSPEPDWFAVMHGEEELERRTTTTATVETSGQTWVDELGLSPSPDFVWYNTAFAWDFTFELEPWEANATAAAGS